eukprot:4641110-Pyramimonas_sp.AAC.1
MVNQTGTLIGRILTRSLLFVRSRSTLTRRRIGSRYVPNQFLTVATPAASIGTAPSLSDALEVTAASTHSPNHGIWAGRACNGQT